jgi:hypothetical protein
MRTLLDMTAAEGRGQVERDFKAWVEGQLEAEGGSRYDG